MLAATELSLQGCHASLQLHHLHIEGGLLASESSDLLLEPSILLLLVGKVTLDVLLNFEQLISESFADVLSLHCQVLLEFSFVGAQNLHLLFVICKLLLN